jgi:hypothetical protein
MAVRSLTRYLSASALICALLSGVGLAIAQTGQTQPPSAPPAKVPPPPVQVSPEEMKARAERFQQRVDEAIKALDSAPGLQQFNPKQRRELIEFVVGNMMFALLHEMGHAHVTEMGLPVLGREEDAADSYAVLAMLKVGSDVSHNVLVQATKGWFLTDEREKKEKIKPAFYDEHGMNQQRAYQIVCYMVGSDPEKFTELANSVKMPQDRQGTCQGDYSNASWSWETLLKPHLRNLDQPKMKIDVVYGPVTEKRYEPIAQAFRTIGILEAIAEYAATRYVWRTPFTVEAQTCGMPDTHWDMPVHKLLTCYEMAREFGELYRDYVLLKGQPKSVKRKPR